MFLFDTLKVKEFGTTLETCKTSGIKKKTSLFLLDARFALSVMLNRSTNDALFNV